MTDEDSKEKHLPVDDITRKKLLYAKQFYIHGEKHARQQNPVDRMIAIHHFHIAVEIALKASYMIHFPDKDLMQIHFPELKSGLKETYPWLEDFNVFLNKLNKTRNKTQHEAEVVAPEDMPDYQMKTWNFLSEFFRRAFGVSFDDLDMASFINDSDLERALIVAKELIELGQNKLSVIVSKSVHSIASRCLEEALQGVDRLSFNSEEVSDLSRRVHKLLGVILAVGNGEWKAYNQFQRIPPLGVSIDPYSVPSGHHSLWPNEEKLPKAQDAKWAREYVIEGILDWQERGFEPRNPDDHYAGREGKKQYTEFFEWVEKAIEAKRKEATS